MRGMKTLRGSQALPGRINGSAFDRYTIGHAAVGTLLGLGAPRWSFWTILAIAVGWELIENPLKDRFTKLFPVATHDSLANATCDVLALLAGWGVVKSFRPREEVA